MAVLVTKFRRYRKETFRGFADVYMSEWGVTINDVAILESDDRRWASVPNVPCRDDDGVVLRKENGKAVYKQTLEFCNRTMRYVLSDRVIASLLETFPDAFDTDEQA